MKSIIFAFVGLFILSGCLAQKKSQYIVSVNSIAKSDISQVAKGKKYFLAHAEKDDFILGSSIMGIYDLQFYEYSRYIDRILKKDGYIKVNTVFKADFIVYLKYGIGKPKTKTYFTNTPIYGKTGVSSVTTSGTSNSYMDINNNNLNVNTFSNSTSTINYDYGVVGYRTQKNQYTKYNRHIILWAKNRTRFSPGKLRRDSVIWSMLLTSSGSSGDLRRVFPIMIAASKDYFLKNSRQKITMRISEDDESVLKVKGIPMKKK